MEVLLVKPKKFKLFSFLIMKIEKTKGSHLCFRWYSNYFQRNLYFTTEFLTGSSIENQSHMDKYDIVQKWKIELTDNEAKDIKIKFIDSLHVKYSLSQILIILLKRIMPRHLFNIILKNKKSNKDKFQICTESVIRHIDIKKELLCYEYIGLKEALKILENRRN